MSGPAGEKKEKIRRENAEKAEKEEIAIDIEEEKLAMLGEEVCEEVVMKTEGVEEASEGTGGAGTLTMSVEAVGAKDTEAKIKSVVSTDEKRGESIGGTVDVKPEEGETGAEEMS